MQSKNKKSKISINLVKKIRFALLWSFLVLIGLTLNGKDRNFLENIMSLLKINFIPVTLKQLNKKKQKKRKYREDNVIENSEFIGWKLSPNSSIIYSLSDIQIFLSQQLLFQILKWFQNMNQE